MRDIAEKLGGVPGVAPISVMTSNGASEAQLVDSALVDSSADTDKLGRPWVHIDETDASGPTAGEVSQVTANGLTIATGAVALSPVFTAAPQSGQNYSFWWEIHPTTVYNLMQQTLREMKRQVFFPVSLVTNPDFENVTSDVGADNWTYTNADVTGTTGYSSTAANVRYGVYSARLKGSGGVPTLQSGSIPAVEGDTWVVAAYGQADTGVVQLNAYDVTGSANIGDTATHQEEAYMQMRVFNVTIPADCEHLAVLLSGTGATDDLYFDAVHAWPHQRSMYTLPSWIEDPKSDLLGFGWFHSRRALQGTSAYMADEGEFIPWPHKQGPIIDEGGARPFVVELETPVTEPLYMKALRPFPALSAVTDTTTAQRELVVYATLGKIYEQLRREAVRAGNSESASLYAQLKGEADHQAQQHKGYTRHGQPEMAVRAPELASY